MLGATPMYVLTVNNAAELQEQIVALIRNRADRQDGVGSRYTVIALHDCAHFIASIHVIDLSIPDPGTVEMASWSRR